MMCDLLATGDKGWHTRLAHDNLREYVYAFWRPRAMVGVNLR